LPDRLVQTPVNASKQCREGKVESIALICRKFHPALLVERHISPENIQRRNKIAGIGIPANGRGIRRLASGIPAAKNKRQ